MPGLREQKKDQTRRELSDAALRLVLERGLENVTREDIAGAAGVSARTFTNYFADKYDAMAYRQRERLRRSIDAFRGRPADEPIWTSITESALAPIEDDLSATVALPDRSELAQIRKLLMSDQIRNALTRDLFDEWQVAIAERSGTDPERDLYPRLVAAVIGAAGDAAMELYAESDPPVAFPVLLRAALDQVAAGLPVPGQR